MSAITVGGDLVHYEVLGHGRGRPVIMVHGWLGSWRYWIPTMQQLHMKYRVYALDLFGYGDSGKNPARYTINQQVDMLSDFMAQLGIKRAAFVGHGMGAMVVSEFAFVHQTRLVPRALLVSTPLFDIGGLDERIPERRSRSVASYHPEDPDLTIPSTSLEATIPSAGMMRAALQERAASRRRGTGRLGGGGTGRLSDPMNNPLADSIGSSRLINLLERCYNRSEDEYRKLSADVEKTENLILENSVRDFDAGKMLDTVQQLQMPTMLIHGTDDPIIPVPTEPVLDYVTREHDDTIPVILPGVRHFPMLEYERFGRLVQDFLETPDLSTLKVKERWTRRSR